MQSVASVCVLLACLTVGVISQPGMV